jgi:hypothetical protein
MTALTDNWSKEFRTLRFSCDQIKEVQDNEYILPITLNDCSYQITLQVEEKIHDFSSLQTKIEQLAILIIRYEMGKTGAKTQAFTYFPLEKLIEKERLIKKENKSFPLDFEFQLKATKNKAEKNPPKKHSLYYKQKTSIILWAQQNWISEKIDCISIKKREASTDQKELEGIKKREFYHVKKIADYADAKSSSSLSPPVEYHSTNTSSSQSGTSSSQSGTSSSQSGTSSSQSGTSSSQSGTSSSQSGNAQELENHADSEVRKSVWAYLGEKIEKVIEAIENVSKMIWGGNSPRKKEIPQDKDIPETKKQIIPNPRVNINHNFLPNLFQIPLPELNTHS